MKPSDSKSMTETTKLTVFITTGEATCAECGEELGHHAWITLTEDQKALCLACADLDHLHFLPAGDAALTRRAGKYSTLSAVVVRWSRARKRYERRGCWSKRRRWSRPSRNAWPTAR